MGDTWNMRSQSLLTRQRQLSFFPSSTHCQVRGGVRGALQGESKIGWVTGELVFEFVSI